jgi:hypothetical protein
MDGRVRLMRVLAIAAVVVAAFLVEGCKSRVAEPEKSVNGFIDVVMPGNAKEDTVIIFAPANCPREAGQRARELNERLTALDIPNVMSANYSLRFTDDSDAFKAKLKRTAGVMQGDLPAVLINGMGKSNPTAEEVAAEYERTTRGK